MNIVVHPDTASVSSTVQIQITNQNDEDHGPIMRIDLATPVESMNPTLSDAEDAMVKSAYELIQRIAREPLDALTQKLEDGRSKENFFAMKP